MVISQRIKIWGQQSLCSPYFVGHDYRVAPRRLPYSASFSRGKIFADPLKILNFCGWHMYSILLAGVDFGRIIFFAYWGYSVKNTKITSCTAYYCGVFLPTEASLLDIFVPQVPAME